MSFSESQLRTLEITERVASSLSIIGCSFIFVTFLASKRFRRPVNRLIFYASWGNMICNVATFISLAGPNAGTDTALCQLQGFMIQFSMPADAMWNLCLAINVYLTIFKKYNTDDLKALEWIYILANYGGPFIPALVYCFISNPENGRIYANATLWCWVSPEWDYLRVATLYGPAWVCIIIAFAIYVMAGKDIWMKRKQLRSFKATSQVVPVIVETPYMSFKTTDITITTELSTLDTTGETPLPVQLDSNSKVLPTHSYQPYTVKIERCSEAQNVPPTPTTQIIVQRQNNAALDANNAAWGYTKCALLLFASLIITWVPSSANRVYSLAHPGPAYWPLAYAAGVVLPLMGFWNSVIYVVTSWGAVQAIFAPYRHHFRPHGWAESFSIRRHTRPRTGRTLGSVEDGLHRRSPESLSDSMKGLAP